MNRPLLVAVFLFATAVQGAEPTTCSFPDALDTFQAVAIGTRWTAEMHNKILCAINELERRSNGESEETVCVAVSNVPAATVQVVTIPLSADTDGTEDVVVSVIDQVNPARLDVVGNRGTTGGTIARFDIFNRDVSNARSGLACARVIR